MTRPNTPDRDSAEATDGVLLPFPRKSPDNLPDGELAPAGQRPAEVEPADPPIEGEIVTEEEYRQHKGGGLQRYRPVAVVVAVVRVVRTEKTTNASRATIRVGITIGQGVGSWIHDWWDKKTHGVIHRAIQAAESAWDKEQLDIWTHKLEEAKKHRHQRRMDAPKVVVGRIIIAGGAVFGLLVLILLIGVIVQATGAGEFLDVIYGVRDGIRWAIEAFPRVVAITGIAAPIIVGYAAWKRGKRLGNLPTWAVSPEKREEESVMVTPMGIAEALTHLGIPALNKALKEGWTVTFIVPPVRVNNRGYQAVFSIPMGVTPDMIADKGEVFARNLHRHPLETWPSASDSNPGYVDLWVCDPGLSEKSAPEYPLLHSGTCDVFSSVPMGVSQRGDSISPPLVERNMVFGGLMGQGKALAIDTLVPTPTGWTTMGALVAGDEVFDEAGQPCRVVTAWPVLHDRPCFELHFSDGEVIVADADHLWLVETASSRRSQSSARRKIRNRTSPFSRNQTHLQSTPKVLSTAEIADTYLVTSYRWHNYSVQVAGALQAEEAELPVPPYTLGAWLGDGTSASGSITTRDPEVLAEIEQEGQPIHVVPSTSHLSAPLWRVDGLTAKLQDAGVLRSKHIPAAYFRASESQRRALLAGLMDSDGYVDRNGSVVFSVCNERLARDVRSLVATLGYKSQLNRKPAKFREQDCGWQWLVTFTPQERVSRLPRKASRQAVAVRPSSRHRYIVDVRSVQSVPVRCITVDSPSSLYLVGDQCIPTHNSNAARTVMLGAALDPIAELWVYVFANNGDFDAYAPRLSRYVKGVEDDVCADALRSLHELYAEVARREQRLAEVRAKKVTRGLAEKHPDLRPVVALFSECHELFSHEEYGKQAADVATQTLRRARKTGVILLFDTQSARAEAIPPKIVELVSLNACFAVKTWRSNDGFLGDGSFQAGIRATELRPGKDRGTSLFTGATPERFEVMKWFFVEVNDDTGFDAATDVIARAVAAMHPSVPSLEDRPALEEAEERNLLEDVAEVLGVETVMAPDIPARLRSLAPHWGPYQRMNGKTLVAELEDLGVFVPRTHNRRPVDPAEVGKAMEQLSTADLDDEG
jgi:hypothetical protein